jgi:uncharacterized sulfatase
MASLSPTRRTFLASLIASAACSTRHEPARPPNVLLIASDDLNATLGCYGHPVVKTPHLDALAARGVLFERAYCQFPFCGPSRASLLTGLRPDSSGVRTNDKVDFRDTVPDAVTLPQLFKNAGRPAMRVGKIFHMGVPGGVGALNYQDPPSWDVSISPPGLEDKSPGEGANLTPDMRGGIAMQWIRTADGSGQADETGAGKAIELIEQNAGEPFFFGLGFVRPHVPFVAPGRFFDMYELEDVKLAQNPPDDLADIPTPAKNLRPFLWNDMGMSEAQQREALRGYYASVSYMDEQVGRALGALERLGLVENTVVAFFGDHGWSLGEHTHWQKMALMEDAVRAPLIVSAPGRQGAGRRSRALVEFVDIYPTLAELGGLQAPATLEGSSFTPLLDDPGRPWKRAAFSQVEWEDRIYGRTVRTDRYRYISWEGDGGGEELYDHEEDSGEFRNLSADVEHAEALAEHRDLLQAGWKAALPAAT